MHQNKLKFVMLSRKPISLAVSSTTKKCFASAAISKQLDDGFLHHSIVPTMHYQPSLPRLPIPSLENTCARYLNGVQPLISVEEFKLTHRVVKEFQENEGKVLHKELTELDRQNKQTSYYAKPWREMYLADRQPIPINYNPGLIFKKNELNENIDPILRATGIIHSSVKFMNSLEANLLIPDVYHVDPKQSDTKWFHHLVRTVPSSLSWYVAYMANAYPLDMSQYKNLFKSTRIPQLDMDRIESFTHATHILVIRKGHFFTLDVVDHTNGCLLPPACIYTQLQSIVDQEHVQPEFPIGILTTENRNTWAKLRQELESDPLNSESLRAIDRALFVVCLDDICNDDPTKLMKQILHGDGINRWFDKSFQIIMTKNGEAAINFEHSWGDGIAVLRYVIDVLDDCMDKTIIDVVSDYGATLIRPKQLQFNLNDNLKAGIDEAKERFNIATESLDAAVLRYQKLNKRILKKHNLSADSVMQLAFQMAYYRMTGSIPAVYESCSTAIFRHGRTECLRPVSMLTKSCCEAFDKNNPSGISELKEYIYKCSTNHSEMVKKASAGQGFDRHMFAMKYLADSGWNKTPNVFLDPTYSKASHFVISTSTLATEYMVNGGFGPVVRNGFGIPYMIREDFVGAVVTSYPPEGHAQEFLDSLITCLNDISDVINGVNFKNK